VSSVVLSALVGLVIGGVAFLAIRRLMTWRRDVERRDRERPETSAIGSR
jgi:uncharacterized integral membrane protein